MALRHSFLHQRLFQHLLGMAGTYPALPGHAKTGFQIPHPVGALMDGFTDSGIGNAFAYTNIHD
jgi:hypothetical protein